MQVTKQNGPVFTTITVTLADGETIAAQSGAMISMSPTVEIATKTQGKGLGGMLKASISGEGLFSTQFTATGGPGEVVIGPPELGDILEFDLNGQMIFANNGAYLAGVPGLEIGTKGSLKAMVSGEGLFLQTIRGTGKVFLSSYGAVFKKTLTAGEHYKVDTGNMVAFEETVTYSVVKAAKGLFATLASGEGLVCDFVGPGNLWVQTRTLSGFAGMIAKFLPKKN